MRRFPVGSYPAKGISEARRDARTLHTRVKHDGVDPIAERKRERATGEAAKAGIGTLAAVLDTYGEKRGNQQSARPAGRNRINLVFRGILVRPVADLQMAADNYAFLKSAAFAVRAIRPALKWRRSQAVNT